MFTYYTSGTCSRQIIFEVDENNKLHGLKFIGGCSGNLQGVARLCEGKDIDEIHSLLAGVKCKNNTSCPDQLSKAIEEYKRSLTENAKK
ncbi:MAG: TIGR03905 family TSCPD domain-containing protein [Clostridia bacterium]|nr:TIGR03905 family TSCPD domain-containing protein [Clostridia bacterium]